MGRLSSIHDVKLGGVSSKNRQKMGGFSSILIWKKGI
jgi:hypothetical protein